MKKKGFFLHSGVIYDLFIYNSYIIYNFYIG